jgi:hypothetical protein
MEMVVCTAVMLPQSPTNPAARWGKAAMKFNILTIFLIVYLGQHANGTAGAQTAMHGGCSYLPLDDILTPPAKDVIDDIGEELDDDVEKQCPNPRWFPIIEESSKHLHGTFKRGISGSSDNLRSSETVH